MLQLKSHLLSFTFLDLCTYLILTYFKEDIHTGITELWLSQQFHSGF
jgi:hypothetical protein